MIFNKWKTILFIAWRYFHAPKSTHAVNIIATIATSSIAVVGIAMVILFSVFNGFESFTKGLYKNFTPDLIVEQKEGKPFSLSTVAELLDNDPEIEKYAFGLKGQAMLVFEENTIPVILYGIDDHFSQVIPLHQSLFDGEFLLEKDSLPQLITGVGIASKLGVNAGMDLPVQIIVPRRIGSLSMVRPDRNFRTSDVFISGVFRVDQSEDGTVSFLPIELLRSLLQYDSDTISEISLKLAQESTTKRTAERLSRLLGSNFVVKDREQQHPDIFRINKIEKWISFSILLFVLLLSLFSIVSTLGMLIIEKRKDTETLRALGAEKWMTRSIVITEGFILSFMGGVIGIATGIFLVVLQAQFGLVKLATSNSGAFLIDSYPVELRFLDIVVSIFTILLVGFLSSLIAYKIFGNKKS